MLFVAGIGGAFAWGDDRPNDLTWILRIGFVALGVVSLGVLLKMYFRRDDASTVLAKSHFQKQGQKISFETLPTSNLAFPQLPLQK
jgi:O-antigen/teichoic acid export membrane protein